MKYSKSLTQLFTLLILLSILGITQAFAQDNGVELIILPAEKDNWPAEKVYENFSSSNFYIHRNIGRTEVVTYSNNEELTFPIQEKKYNKNQLFKFERSEDAGYYYIKIIGEKSNNNYLSTMIVKGVPTTLYTAPKSNKDQLKWKFKFNQSKGILSILSKANEEYAISKDKSTGTRQLSIQKYDPSKQRFQFALSYEYSRVNAQEFTVDIPDRNGVVYTEQGEGIKIKNGDPKALRLVVFKLVSSRNEVLGTVNYEQTVDFSDKVKENDVLFFGRYTAQNPNDIEYPAYDHYAVKGDGIILTVNLVTGQPSITEASAKMGFKKLATDPNSYSYDLRYMDMLSPFNAPNTPGSSPKKKIFRDLSHNTEQYSWYPSSIEGSFAVHHSWDATPTNTSNEKMESTYYKNEYEFQKSFSIGGTASVGIAETKGTQGTKALPGGTGTLSGSYKSTKKETQSEDRTYVVTGKTKETYTVTLREANSQLTPDFEDAIKGLPTSYNAGNKSQFVNFINNWGTHYPISVIYGGRFASIMSMTNEQAGKFEERGWDAAREVEATFKGVTVGQTLNASSTTTKNFEEIQKNSKLESNSYGGTVNDGKWTVAPINAAPVYYTLQKLGDVIKNKTAYNQQGDALNKAIDVVMNEYKTTNKVVDTYAISLDKLLLKEAKGVGEKDNEFFGKISISNGYKTTTIWEKNNKNRMKLEQGESGNLHNGDVLPIFTKWSEGGYDKKDVCFYIYVELYEYDPSGGHDFISENNRTTKVYVQPLDTDTSGPNKTLQIRHKKGDVDIQYRAWKVNKDKFNNVLGQN